MEAYERLLQGNNISNCARDYFVIFWQQISYFFLFPNNRPETKLKNTRFISLADIDSVTWLLVITRMQVHNVKEQAGKINKSTL